jgi:mono/diheme cytochrome c family protein
MHRSLSFVILLVLAVVMLSACKPTAPASSGTPQASAVTAGQLAEQGKTVYARSCAACHGDQGQGANAPALIGTGEGLAKYGDAQQLLEKISTTMPKGAPGSLSEEEYLHVLSFLLVEDNLVKADAVIPTDALSGIEVR